MNGQLAKMKALRDAHEQSLTWLHPSTPERTYQLLSGDLLLASLHWEKPEGSLAIGQSADGRWTFKRQGFLRPRVTIRTDRSTSDIALVPMGWDGSGVVELSDGRSFGWRRTSFWRPEWEFIDAEGRRLLHFNPEFKPPKATANVRVEPAAFSVPELSLLSLLGWYLIVLMLEDDTAMSRVRASAPAIV